MSIKKNTHLEIMWQINCEYSALGTASCNLFTAVGVCKAAPVHCILAVMDVRRELPSQEEAPLG